MNPRFWRDTLQQGGKAEKAAAVWGIFFPKRLSTPLLFCIHYIKRIHLHLISRELAWSFCLLFSVCAAWQSVNGPTEKLKNKVENFSSHCQPLQVSRLVNAWQLLVCPCLVLLCPAGNLRSKPSGWDEGNHPRNYSVWASSAKGNGLFGKDIFPVRMRKCGFSLATWYSVMWAIPAWGRAADDRRFSQPVVWGSSHCPMWRKPRAPGPRHVRLSCPFPPSQSLEQPQGPQGRRLPVGDAVLGTGRGAQRSLWGLYLWCWIAQTLCPLGLALNHLNPENNHWDVSSFRYGYLLFCLWLFCIVGSISSTCDPPSAVQMIAH